MYSPEPSPHDPWKLPSLETVFAVLSIGDKDSEATRPISFFSLQSEPKGWMSFPPQVTMAIVQARAQSSQAQQYAGITLSKAGE